MKTQKVYENERFSNLTSTGESYEDLIFSECEFEDVTLMSPSFTRCVFRDCRFIRCRIESPRARETFLTRAEFDGCFLSGVQWCEFVPGNRFSEMLCAVRDSTVRYSNFSQMSFPKFDFSSVGLIECMFAECDLKTACFRGTELSRTEFFRCDMQEADFRDAFGYQIDVLTCKVRGARFSFPEAIGLLGSLGVKID